MADENSNSSNSLFKYLLSGGEKSVTQTKEKYQYYNSVKETNSTIIKSVQTDNNFNENEYSSSTSNNLDLIQEKSELNHESNSQQNQLLLKKQKKFDWLLYILLFANLMINAGYMLVAPFFQEIAQIKGLQESTIGYVIAAHPIGGFISALVLGDNMKFMGRKNAIIWSIVLQIVGSLSTTSAVFIDSQIAFTVLMIFNRFIMGVGLSVYGTCQLTIITQMYPEEVNKYCAIVESTTGLGLLLGPLLGSGLFYIGHNMIFGTENGGFQTCFIGITIVYILLIPLCYKLIPQDQKSEVEEVRSKVSLFKFLFSPRVFVSFLIILVSTFSISYMEPFLEQHLRDYNLEIEQASLMFSLEIVTYIPTLALCTYFPRRVDQRILFILGMVILVLGQLLIGPDPHILPDKLYIVIIGLLVLGIGQALIVIPIIPEFIYLGKIYFMDESYEETIYEFASSLYEALFSLSGILGPILSGQLMEVTDFKSTTSYFGYSQVIILGVYLVFCGAISAIFRPYARYQILLKFNYEEKEESSYRKQLK